MPVDLEANESTRLLPRDRRLSQLQPGDGGEATSLPGSHVSKEEQLLGDSPVGERLPYNDYTTIDWLHDLVKDSFRFRSIHAKPGIRHACLSAFDSCGGWIASAITGILTACVAFCVDLGVATVSDWKHGYCMSNVFASREVCCTTKSPLLSSSENVGESCDGWHFWTTNYAASFTIYTGFALAFGIISSSLTMLTKAFLPAAAPDLRNQRPGSDGRDQKVVGKSMYMAAGSGIPEIKTILSGFVIPHFLDLKVLVVKAVGAVFAVSTCMTLGKEGPFVHISTCVAWLVAQCFPKYRENGRKLRELLAAGCASGLSVAFGAPIGGVLFSYEEISTFFPRKVLWRAFLCSLFAAVVLKALNPTGTGKLVLFETNYGTSYKLAHYLVFIILGISGGIFGGVFCSLNFKWSKHFRKYSVIKNHPVLEVFLVVLVTSLLQFPNPLTREPGDIIIKNLLVDCHSPEASTSWVCRHEIPSSTSNSSPKASYIAWLVHGTITKLLLTTITFGIKVPSGIIIPALDAGAFFGRLIGQLIPSISPGIFAMVGAAAFLAGVSRMTISLCVIMLELTGELEYVVPHMVAILAAKWVADAIEHRGVYDLAQTVLGHPFLDLEHATQLVQRHNRAVQDLIPPAQTMREISVDVAAHGRVARSVLAEKLAQLKSRGLLDAGLVLVRNGMLQGYLAEGELEFGLGISGDDDDHHHHHHHPRPHHEMVRLLPPENLPPENLPPDNLPPGSGIIPDESGHDDQEPGELPEFDMSMFVDRTPLAVCAQAPVEYAVEMFGKLGLRYLCVVEDGTGRLVGVIIKKRLVSWLEKLGR